MREMRNAYKSLVGKLELKRPLGKHGDRWKSYITMNLKSEIRWVM
jgi:hypothetical protein